MRLRPHNYRFILDDVKYSGPTAAKGKEFLRNQDTAKINVGQRVYQMQVGVYGRSRYFEELALRVRDARLCS